MIKNKYTETIDTVKISNEALNKALQNVRYNKKTTAAKNKPKVIWKTTSAVAACMAAVIAVGGIFLFLNDGVVDSIIEGNLPEVQNSFVVLANSQKLTADSEVTIGEFYGTNSYLYGYITESSGKGIDDIYNKKIKDEPIEYFQVGVTLQIPIHCEGDNIESITYSVEKYADECESINSRKECFDMYLCADEAYDGVIDSNATDEFRKEKGFYSWTKVGTSFTFAYDKQPVGYEQETSWEKFKHRTSKLELPLQFCCKNEKYPGLTPTEYFSLHRDTETDETLIDFVRTDVMKESFAKYYDNLRIDIIANFTNGTSQTKTVQLLCETVETGDTVKHSANVIKGVLVEE